MQTTGAQLLTSLHIASRYLLLLVHPASELSPDYSFDAIPLVGRRPAHPHTLSH